MRESLPLTPTEAKGFALDGMKLPSSGGDAEPSELPHASTPPATSAVIL
jgi:hypothetical protein